MYTVSQPMYKVFIIIIIITSNVETHSKSPPTFSQIEVVASKLATASNFPDGDQEQDRTVLVCVSSKTA